MSYQRITFTDASSNVYNIGYLEWLVPSYEGNPLARIIPRAKGVQVYSGEEMGGGQLNIEVGSFMIKNTRLEVEQELITLIQNLANKMGTLKVETTGITLSNCAIKAISPDSNSDRWNYFTITFVASI